MSLVTDHLAARGVPFETIHHPQAYTSIDEALALGMAADEVVKTVLVDTPSGHALVVIPGSRRVEMRLVRRAVGDNHARLATEAEIEKGFPGYELGALPPLASLLRVPTYRRSRGQGPRDRGVRCGHPDGVGEDPDRGPHPGRAGDGGPVDPGIRIGR